MFKVKPQDILPYFLYIYYYKSGFMERIVLEVGDATAKKWQYVEPKTKQRIYKTMDRILNSLLDRQAVDLWQFLEKVRAEAEKKGFNDDILDEILNEK